MSRAHWWASQAARGLFNAPYSLIKIISSSQVGLLPPRCPTLNCCSLFQPQLLSWRDFCKQSFPVPGFTCTSALPAKHEVSEVTDLLSRLPRPPVPCQTFLWVRTASPLMTLLKVQEIELNAKMHPTDDEKCWWPDQGDPSESSGQGGLHRGDGFRPGLTEGQGQGGRRDRSSHAGSRSASGCPEGYGM